MSVWRAASGPPAPDPGPGRPSVTNRGRSIVERVWPADDPASHHARKKVAGRIGGDAHLFITVSSEAPPCLEEQ